MKTSELKTKKRTQKYNLKKCYSCKEQLIVGQKKKEHIR